MIVFEQDKRICDKNDLWMHSVWEAGKEGRFCRSISVLVEQCPHFQTAPLLLTILVSLMFPSLPFLHVSK